MKPIIKFTIVILAMGCVYCSCKKEADKINSPPPPSPPVYATLCNDRPVINARLVQIGSLSLSRIGLVSANAGNKILFAGGGTAGAYSSRVDIYDTITGSWSTAELSKAERDGMAVAAIGNKIFFAGGADNDNGMATSRVDIYDASNNTWSIAELSTARASIVAAILGNKVFFAGGSAFGPHLLGFKVVDIFDNSTNTWTTASLSQGREGHSATTVGNKIYFAGGQSGYSAPLNVLNTIDVFDGATNSWSTSTLQEPKAHMAGIAVDNKIFWAGGIKTYTPTGFAYSTNVEIRDMTTGLSSFACIIPRHRFSAVTKGDYIVFFTGSIDNNSHSGTHFDIYNTKTDQWFTGLLDKKICDATIISVNNTIYVAGGRDHPGGPLLNGVWKLEF